MQLLGEGIRVEEPSLFQFSSGTTGDPKLIARSWQEVAQEIDGYNAVIPASNDEVPIILVPVSHSYGLIAGTMTALERGVEPIIVQVEKQYDIFFEDDEMMSGRFNTVEEITSLLTHKLGLAS